MKIKMAATMLLCSFVILCGEVNAAGSSGQLLQGADCGCGAAPTVDVGCGCEAADQGCGCRQPVRGLLSKLRSGCGSKSDCGCQATVVPAPVVDCGCAAAPVADCGCDAAPSCGCRAGKGLRGFFERVGGQVPSDCGCGPTCEEPEPVVADCGCAPEPVVADCGCGDAAPARTCGCKIGGLIGRLRSRSCGCRSAGASNDNFGGVYEPVVAPAADCGCDAAPAAAPSCGCGSGGGLLGRLKGGCGCGSAAAPVADCGCAPAPVAAPVADCGCESAPAPAPSCGCGSGGLLGRLKGGCGCGSSAPAPAADCGCGSGAPVADCGCGSGIAAAPSCGSGLLGRLGGGCGCGSASADCGCGAAPAAAPSCGGGNSGLLGRFGGGGAASSCGCSDAPACGCRLGQHSGGGLLGGGSNGDCNRCGSSSCNGGCRLRRNRGGVTLLNRLRGDRIVRDTSKCGQCLPACPNQGHGDCGCSSCGNVGVIQDYAPTMHSPTMQVAPPVQQMAPIAIPATTEGSIVPSPVVPTGASKKVQPVVDSAAFIIRNQK